MRKATWRSDENRLIAIGLEMRDAHAQYRATLDERAALFELRQALSLAAHDYAAIGCPG